jgi:hypothetical protein
MGAVVARGRRARNFVDWLDGHYTAGMEDDRPTAREGFNRLIGLSSYALGVVLTSLLLFSIYEEGFGNLYGLSIGGAIALICFAIGFTTNKRK